jgi:hypothetical protein
MPFYYTGSRLVAKITLRSLRVVNKQKLAHRSRQKV